MVQEGLLVVVSGPSGAGKSTVCAKLKEQMPDLSVSVSVTTREPRKGECEGVNYFFRTQAVFDDMVQNDGFLEYAHIYGNNYGTPKEYVLEKIKAGQNVLLEIEMQGALQVKERFPQGVFIFVVPPSLAELKHRIIGRGSETPETLMRRFSSAYHELSYLDHYNYVVVNDSVEEAAGRIESIMVAERCRTGRNAALRANLMAEGENMQ